MLCLEVTLMARHDTLDVPEAELPEFLRGLEPPVTTDDALAYAEAHGAPPEVLAFIEALPAAVFTTPEGMRHAFSALRPGQIPPTDAEHVLLGKDGTSS